MPKQIKVMTLLVMILLIAPNYVYANPSAMEIHQKAWMDVATKALTNPEYKYAIYMARTLAVAHPEVYLQADKLFNDVLTSERGMQEFYEYRGIRAFNEKEYDDLVRNRSRGKRFKWSDFDSTGYTVVDQRKIYQDSAAFLDFLDLRLQAKKISWPLNLIAFIRINLIED
jgi:hypothetical protein